MDELGKASDCDDPVSAEDPSPPPTRPHFSISSILGLDPPRHPQLAHISELHSREDELVHTRRGLGGDWHQHQPRPLTSGHASSGKDFFMHDQQHNSMAHNTDDDDDRHERYHAASVHDRAMDDDLLEEDELEDDELELEDDEELLMRGCEPGYSADSTSLSAFVRPLPMRVGDANSSVGDSHNLTSLLNGETSALPPQLTTTLTSSPFAPLWYPPWMAAFKPVFGLQGGLRIYLILRSSTVIINIETILNF